MFSDKMYEGLLGMFPQQPMRGPDRVFTPQQYGNVPYMDAPQMPQQINIGRYIDPQGAEAKMMKPPMPDMKPSFFQKMLAAFPGIMQARAGGQPPWVAALQRLRGQTTQAQGAPDPIQQIQDALFRSQINKPQPLAPYPMPMHDLKYRMNQPAYTPNFGMGGGAAY